MAAVQSVERYQEEVPFKNWLVSVQNRQRQREWFVRFEIGGLYPRRLGPFPTQGEAAHCYNETVRHFLNTLAGQQDVSCFVGDELASAYLGKRVGYD